MNPKRSKTAMLLMMIGLLAFVTNVWAAAMNAKPIGKLNLNSADAKQLVMLPGIGKAKAEAILKLKAQIGSFKKLDDILKVKGIGPKLFARLTPYIKLEGNSDLSLPKTPKASS